MAHANGHGYLEKFLNLRTQFRLNPDALTRRFGRVVLITIVGSLSIKLLLRIMKRFQTPAPDTYLGLTSTSSLTEESDASVDDAARGCIFGALLGDATGTYFEFKRGDEITDDGINEAFHLLGGGPFGVGPAQYTDDGEMTVSSLIALGEYNQVQPFGVAAHAKWYREWLKSDPFDIGIATRTGLGPLARDNSPEAAFSCYQQALAENDQSESNGALMRATPLAVFGRRLLAEQADQFACLVSLDVHFTHSNALVHAAVVSYAVAIATMLRDDTLGNRELALEAAANWLKAHEWGVVKTKRGEMPLWQYFENYIANCPADDSDLADGSALGKQIDQQSQGWLMFAYTLAFRHLRRGTRWREAVERTVRLGGDTDTNACIVGGLVGCADGLASLDQLMVGKLINMDPSMFSGPKSGRLRPQHFAGRYLHKYIDKVLDNAPGTLAFGESEQRFLKDFMQRLSATSATQCD